MAILNYTTSISCEKTIGEIQKCLVAHGAVKIVTDYTGQIPSGVTFCLPVNGSMIGFTLPANYAGVLRSMKKDPKVPDRLCTDEQATRVSWRIIKDWVIAQMAIVDAQVAEVAEVFLPYAIHNGTTLYQSMKGNDMKMLN